MITKQRYISVFAICLLLVFAGCAGLAPQNTVTQISTIDALLTGAYDGSMTCGELLKHGNLGIGTFDRLDGEMVMADGVVYQVRADGKVYAADKTLTTPFAAVCRFSPDRAVAFAPGATYEQVQAALDKAAPNTNLFCAIDITGTFSRMHTRSVPAQTKPYPPLAQVTSHQPEFVMENVSGRIVGFRSPAYVKGIGVPGYHLHFISEDRTQGGHILAFEMANGAGAVDVCDRFLLLLPGKDAMFGAADLSVDRAKELEAVEK
ncbi:acetolactate decarboxylase [Desulfosudis oleivorans]|uniref:Alpha-acetolactate decarboxylase n=1 Tax=Desulfosudis oleivorans (strain DSM 6200 / JCM 39069 / Hxd3) TaxID=96561 RepID=A8ZV07_DESOH|nr:acetolactate decarboxylase [Desulfosudis oleivorans]ABW68097.1 Acetolactate decarboxylase [Desulfosudis oleivorans Hxd3]